MNRFTYLDKVYSNQDDSLISVNATLYDSLTAESLSVDSMVIRVKDDSLEPAFLGSRGLLGAGNGNLVHVKKDGAGLKQYEYGTPCQYYKSQEPFFISDDDLLVGEENMLVCPPETESGLLYAQYLTSIKRITRNQWELSTVSAIGLLMSSDHYGGLYNGETLGEVLEDIVGGIVPYGIQEELAAVRVRGHLKKRKRRDNLHELLFAYGGEAGKDENGLLYFRQQTEKAPYAVEPEAVYMGGSVTGVTPATEVAVTEHRYFKALTGQPETLFEGDVAAEIITTPKGAAAEGAIVDFEAPVYDLQCSGATILEYGPNYAVLSATAYAVLTGKKYAHSRRILAAVTGAAGPELRASSSECGLVNLLNSENVLARMKGYYGAAQKIEIDMVLTKQKPGDAITFTDPFGDPQTGYIEQLDAVVSSVVKARASISTGYKPGHGGNFYSRVILITESGSFTVPEDCKGKLRIVVGGGGTGGWSGGPGTVGGEDAKGGAKGQGGPGGKVLVATIAAQPGDLFEAVIGTGGAGGICTEDGAGAGQEGTASSFGVYSSENGGRSDDGYAELFDGEIYSGPGIEGVADGALSGQSLTINGQTWVTGTQGQYDSYQAEIGASLVFVNGGLGGGPAYGANGENGKNAVAAGTSTVAGAALEGDGGKGASATIPGAEGTIPGQGGQGGSGGGAGGNIGNSLNVSAGYDFRKPGQGGLGSRGGPGAPGYILVYL